MFGIFVQNVFMEENQYKRKKEPEINKQLIIDAAADISFESDWSQVTFQAIANRTGFSKGGIIHHFKSKEELLDELVNQSLIDLTQWIATNQSENPEMDTILSYFNSIITQQNDQKYGKTMRVILQAIVINPKYREQWKNWYAQHIVSLDKNELDTKSLIILLLAEGFWYSENVGTKVYSEHEKTKILTFIKSIKN